MAYAKTGKKLGYNLQVAIYSGNTQEAGLLDKSLSQIFLTAEKTGLDSYPRRDKMAFESEVLVIGAGLAGLSCALHLQNQGVKVTILEAAEEAGGRIRTDKIDGFLLDRGFQIYLTAYPEGKEILDYRSLNFKKFFPGAVIRKNNKFYRVADPLRSPKDIFATLTSPVGKPADKVKVACLQKQLQIESLDEIFEKPECTTYEVLRREGFSRTMIDQFFRPFLGGIFLEKELKTSSQVFEFVFKMLASGENVIPEQGMQEIPRQLAGKLKSGTIQFGKRVKKIEKNKVTLETGESIEAPIIVIATEQTSAVELLGKDMSPNYCSQTCIYFTSEKAPLEEPVLVLNGDEEGYVNNLVVLSNVSKAYAPPGQALTAVSCVGDPAIGDAELIECVKNELRQWYGEEVKDWQHLKTYRVRYSLPAQSPTARNSSFRSYQASDDIFVCGDYLETGSINGALKSGRIVAGKILTEKLARV